MKHIESGSKVALGTSIILVVLLSVGAANLDETQVRETDLEYVDRILGYLNNNDECTLPSFKEVDELQKVFTQMELEQSSSFEAQLSDDQRMVSSILLRKWEEFRKTFNSPVIIESSRIRIFLSRIEQYQLKKFGTSVCAQISIKGPVTDRIFEINPHVHYAKQPETGIVDDSSTQPEVGHEAEAKVQTDEKERTRVEAAIAAEEEARMEAVHAALENARAAQEAGLAASRAAQNAGLVASRAAQNAGLVASKTARQGRMTTGNGAQEAGMAASRAAQAAGLAASKAAQRAGMAASQRARARSN